MNLTHNPDNPSRNDTEKMILSVVEQWKDIEEDRVVELQIKIGSMESKISAIVSYNGDEAVSVRFDIENFNQLLKWTTNAWCDYEEYPEEVADVVNEFQNKVNDFVNNENALREIIGFYPSEQLDIPDEWKATWEYLFGEEKFDASPVRATAEESLKWLADNSVGDLRYLVGFAKGLLADKEKPVDTDFL